jgi:hypothetical protein
MEDLTILFLHTKWRAQSHQFIVDDDGLIQYGSHRLKPLECYNRFIIDYPMFNVLRTEVCQKIPTPGEEKDYRWVTLELLKGN